MGCGIDKEDDVRIRGGCQAEEFLPIAAEYNVCVILNSRVKVGRAQPPRERARKSDSSHGVAGCIGLTGIVEPHVLGVAKRAEHHPIGAFWGRVGMSSIGYR